MYAARAIGTLAASMVLVAAACTGTTATTAVPSSVAATVETPQSSAAPVQASEWATGISWAWVLTGGDIAADAADVDVVDVDLFETPASEVARIERSGVRTVCYLSAGTFEEARPDAGDYPEAILGATWDEWDERYVDVRRIDLLGLILSARLDLCASKGFSAVEPDNIDTYAADTGFPLTEADAVAFARWIADEAHRRGLAVAQKNAPELAPQLVDAFDFAVTEDCFDDGWCAEMAPYREAHKAILDAEYTDRMETLDDALCTRAADLGVSVLLADRLLTENFDRCP